MQMYLKFAACSEKALKQLVLNILSTIYLYIYTVTITIVHSVTWRIFCCLLCLLDKPTLDHSL
jgi:hypothetical protein